MSVPDFRSPSIIPLAVVIGGLLGAAIGRARGVDRQRLGEIAENWAFALGVLATLVYLVAATAGV